MAQHQPSLAACLLLLFAVQTASSAEGIDTYRSVPGVGRYRIHVEPRPYSEAVQVCANEEAHLAVPRSRRVEDALIELLGGSQWLLGFVGVNDIVVEGTMVTVLGELWSNVRYTKWESGEPNNSDGAEDCVIITRKRLLNDWNCSSSLGFLCEKNDVPAATTPRPQACAALRPGPGLVVECSRDGDVVSCARDAQPGTTAIATCAPGYAHASGRRLFATTCRGGGWSSPLVHCDVDCGRVAGESGRPFVAGGVAASAGEAPWHVGVYKQVDGAAQGRYDQRCGGTLITPSIVISAAHCFWSESEHNLLNSSLFLVAAGQLLRDLGAAEQHAQRRSVAEITVPDRYTGSRNNFQQDIAVVRLARPVSLGGAVNVACYNWNAGGLVAIAAGDNGTVAGWGFDGINVQSATLQSAQLAYVPFEDCWNLFANSTAFRAYITADKICAGWSGRGISVCPGDSGGGLVFPKATRAGRRFYLRGVVSVGPVTPGGGACSVDSVATFTDVTLHATFLQVHVRP